MEEYIGSEEYFRKLASSKYRAFHDVLMDATNEIAGNIAVISSSNHSDYIQLWRSPLGFPRKDDIENRAFVSKWNLEAHILAYKLMKNLSDDYEPVTLQGKFSVPAIQIPQVIDSMKKVRDYNGSSPFYAVTFPIRDFKNN